MPQRSKKVVKQALERDCVCQWCGATGDLVVHHIIPLIKDGPDTLDNVMVLCDWCHHETHWPRVPAPIPPVLPPSENRHLFDTSRTRWLDIHTYLDSEKNEYHYACCPWCDEELAPAYYYPEFDYSGYDREMIITMDWLRIVKSHRCSAAEQREGVNHDR